MFTVAELIALGRAYIAGTGVTEHKLSTVATGNIKTFAALFSGKDCLAGTAERASLWFLENWPEELPWPADVPRLAVLTCRLPMGRTRRAPAEAA